MRRLRGTATPARLLLVAILVAGLVLRVAHNDYGLPFVWSLDESTHFTSRAVLMFREGPDPGYYQNPTGFTYLLYALFRTLYGPLGSIFHLPFGNVTAQFAKDPTQLWIAARTLAAVLCSLSVVAVYYGAGRIWSRREGVVAAAVLAFAFLPVAYSRIAVTDVGSLIGVALGLYFAVRAGERGRLRHFLLAGACAGLALSFKYTAGLVLLPLAIAAAGRLREDRLRAVAHLAAAGAMAVVVFVALNPYMLLHFSEFRHDLRGQSDITSNVRKPGQQDSGLAYYLDSLRWGFGWLAGLAALVGLGVEAARDRWRALILAAMPLALFLYLALQARYFGRWLLPAYPALALLAAAGVVRAAELVRGRPAVRAAALVGLTAVVLVQPVAADVRSAQVLGRPDTREQTRSFLAHRYAPGLRAAIEPAVPGSYYGVNSHGRLPPSIGRCAQRPGWSVPGFRFRNGYGKTVCERFKPGQFSRPAGGVRASAYQLVVDPHVIDQYRRYGYCIVVTFGVVRDRALAAGGPDVRAYYRRLERESDLLRTFSPYDRGAKPVPFSFDLSYNYYDGAYHRPGPVAKVYRLRRCRQRYGPPPVQIPQAREVRRGVQEDLGQG
jgi:4-amino-4-deoxy-L-arabinose transferase-like glycosyltransferase